MKLINSKFTIPESEIFELEFAGDFFPFQLSDILLTSTHIFN